MRAKLIVSTAMAALLALMPLETAAAQEIARERDPAATVSVMERPRPEYDPLGVRLGGFDLNASVGLGVTSTDNVFASDTGEESDIIYSIAPEARLASHWSRHALALRAGAYSDKHNDFDSDDVTNYFAGADGRLDILRSGEIGVGVSTNKQHESRSDPDSPLGIAEPVEYNRDEVYLSGRYAFNRLRLTGRVDRNTYDYEDTPLTAGGFLDQDNRDHDETEESLRAEIAITPRFAALVEGAVNQHDYDDSSLLRDSDGSRYGLGFSFDVTDLIRGEALVTQYSQDYDDPTIGTVDGTGFAGHLEWFPTQITTVNADASRSVEDSSIVGASFVLTQAGVRVDHELLRNVILQAGVRSEKREYEGIDRNDDLVGADLGVQYLMNRRVRLNVGYSYRQNDSNAPGEDFEENRLSAGVSFHL